MLWKAVAVTVRKAIKKYAYNACVISMGYYACGVKWQKCSEMHLSTFKTEIEGPRVKIC